MARPKTPAERNLSPEEARIQVGMTVRFRNGTFHYRVVEIRKKLIKAVGENNSILFTEPDGLEVVE